MSRKYTLAIYSLAASSFSLIGWGVDGNPEETSQKRSESSLNQEFASSKTLLKQIDSEILETCPEIRHLCTESLNYISLINHKIIKAILSYPERVKEFKNVDKNFKFTFNEQRFIDIIHLHYKICSKLNAKFKSNDQDRYLDIEGIILLHS